MALSCRPNGVDFRGVDTASLAVPEVECSPVREAGVAGGARDLRFDAVAGRDGLSETPQTFGCLRGNRSHLVLPTDLGPGP